MPLGRGVHYVLINGTPRGPARVAVPVLRDDFVKYPDLFHDSLLEVVGVEADVPEYVHGAAVQQLYEHSVFAVVRGVAVATGDQGETVRIRASWPPALMVVMTF